MIKTWKIQGKKLMDHFCPYPMMSHLEMKYILSLSVDKSHIIEFGAGNSTLFWSKTYSKVTSVEHNLVWFNKIKKRIAHKTTNTQLLFVSPESVAFSENGVLHAHLRSPTDYGTPAEFSRYLEISEKLIMSQKTPCVILIDGPVRHELLLTALSNNINHEILMHDVNPDRAYLNPWLLELNDHIVNIIDSLVHLRTHKN